MMNINSLNTTHLIAINQAMSGHVSGCLREWPILQDAFKRLNLPDNFDMTAEQAKNLSHLIYRTWPGSIALTLKGSDEKPKV